MAEFDKAILPGREGKVNVTIDGKKLPSEGHFDKKFTVKTNDPANKQVILNMQGNIVRVLEIPGNLRLSGFADEKLKLEATITNQLSTPVHITGATWLDDSAEKKFSEKVGLKLETIEKGKKYRLKIWTKKELKASNFTRNVVLTTDYAGLREKKVLVTFLIRNDIEVQPERVLYGEMIMFPGGAKSFERVFDVIANRGDSLRVVKVVPNRSDMKVTMREVTPGKSYRGTISITPGGKTAPYLGSIKIHTNYPRSRELNLDVVGSVRKTE